MAIDGPTLIDAADSTTDWSITGPSATVATTTEFPKQGSANLIIKWEATAAGQVVVLTYTIPTAVDMTGELLFTWGNLGPRAKNIPELQDKDPASNGPGFAIQLEDSAGNFKRFHVAGKDTIGEGGWDGYAVDPAAVDPDVFSGTLDVTDIKLIRFHFEETTAKKNESWVDAIFRGKGVTVEGVGTSSVPINWQDLIDDAETDGYPCVQARGTVIFVQGKILFDTTASDTFFEGRSRAVHFVGERRDAFTEIGIIGEGNCGFEFATTGAGNLHVSMGVLDLVAGKNVVSKGLRFDCGFYAGEIINLASTTSDEVNFYGAQLAKFASIKMGDNSTTVDEVDVIGLSADNCGQFLLNLGTASKWEQNLIGSPYEAFTDATVDTLAFNVVSSGQGRDTITRTTGDFIADGWQAGMTVTITGADLSGNNGTFLVFDVAALTLTLARQQDLTADASDANAQLKREVDGQVKIDFNPDAENFRDTLIQSTTRAILIDAAGTYAMRAITFANNGKDLKTTHASGVVTYQILEGGDTPTTDQFGAGTIVIENNVAVKLTAIDAKTLVVIQSVRALLEADTGGDLPVAESVTITRVGATASVVHTAHGITSGQKVTIRGAVQVEYNGVFVISNVTVNGYDYTVSGTPATPATGTITATGVLVEGLTNASGVVENATFPFTTNQPTTGTARKSTATPRYKAAPLTGSVTSSGYDQNTFLVRDD